MKSINIKVINVEVQKVPGKNYSKCNVAYKEDNGKVNAKNLMSFVAPDVYNFFAESQFDAESWYTVEMEKEGDYWTWKAVHRQDEAPKTEMTAAKPAPTKPTYETPDERALRQRMIVAQSSLSSAVELCKDHGKQPETASVLEVADEFYNWVMTQVQD